MCFLKLNCQLYRPHIDRKVVWNPFQRLFGDLYRFLVRIFCSPLLTRTYPPRGPGQAVLKGWDLHLTEAGLLGGSGFKRPFGMALLVDMSE